MLKYGIKITDKEIDMIAAVCGLPEAFDENNSSMRYESQRISK